MQPEQQLPSMFEQRREAEEVVAVVGEREREREEEEEGKAEGREEREREEGER